MSKKERLSNARERERERERTAWRTRFFRPRPSSSQVSTKTDFCSPRRPPFLYKNNNDEITRARSERERENIQSGVGGELRPTARPARPDDDASTSTCSLFPIFAVPPPSPSRMTTPSSPPFVPLANRQYNSSTHELEKKNNNASM